MRSHLMSSLFTPAAALATLRFGGVVLIAFGVLFALGAWPPVSAPTAFLFDLIVWPLDGGPSIEPQAARLSVGLLGGVLVGWGVMIERWAAAPDAGAAAFARSALLPGVLAWFVVDSAASVAAGAPLNAALNCGFLAVFAIPALALGDAATRPA